MERAQRREAEGDGGRVGLKGLVLLNPRKLKDEMKRPLSTSKVWPRERLATGSDSSEGIWRNQKDRPKAVGRFGVSAIGLLPALTLLSSCPDQEKQPLPDGGWGVAATDFTLAAGAHTGELTISRLPPRPKF